MSAPTIYVALECVRWSPKKTALLVATTRSAAKTFVWTLHVSAACPSPAPCVRSVPVTNPLEGDTCNNRTGVCYYIDDDAADSNSHNNDDVVHALTSPKFLAIGVIGILVVFGVVMELTRQVISRRKTKISRGQYEPLIAKSESDLEGVFVDVVDDDEETAYGGDEIKTQYIRSKSNSKNRVLIIDKGL